LDIPSLGSSTTGSDEAREGVVAVGSSLGSAGVALICAVSGGNVATSGRLT